MPIQGTCRPSARTAVRVPLSTAIMRGTPAIVTGSERELWKPISKPSISDWATSERRARGHVEEAGEEGRRREGDGEPKDDPEAHAGLAIRRVKPAPISAVCDRSKRRAAALANWRGDIIMKCFPGKKRP